MSEAKATGTRASATAPDPAMRQAIMAVAGTALVLAAIAGFVYGMPAALGVVAGGALATANLAFFARLVAAFLTQKGNSAPWAVLGMLKLLGLFAVAYIVLNSGLFSAIWFAVGYGSLPIGITVGTLLRKPPEEPEEAAVPTADGSGAPEDPSESRTSAPAETEGTPPDEDVLDAPRRE